MAIAWLGPNAKRTLGEPQGWAAHHHGQAPSLSDEAGPTGLNAAPSNNLTPAGRRVAGSWEEAAWWRGCSCRSGRGDATKAVCDGHQNDLRRQAVIPFDDG